MKHFVLVYNRRTHELTHEELPDAASALHRRFALERIRTDPDVEIVSFGSRSLETLRTTHSRYFTGAGAMVAKAAKTRRYGRRFGRAR